MSSELERLLREGRTALPDPDEDATRRGRARALAAIRRRRPRRRLRSLVALGTALVVAIGLGVGIGASIAPTGTAAQGPVGLGFLPDPGWYVLQSGGRVTLDRPAVSIAANVPFAPDDDVGGIAESSGLPYSTLLTLPPQGVVIVAIFTPLYAQPWLNMPRHETDLPLRVRDAVPYIQYGAQVRPEEPLGQYQIRTLVNGHDVDLNIYFGRERPTRAQLAAAQRQLDGLVVRAPARRQPSSASTSAAPSVTVIDRKLVCATGLSGGVRELEARAHEGIRASRSVWKQLPFAAVSSGDAGISGSLSDSLAWITAGRPSAATTIDTEWRTTPVRANGTLGLRSGCRSSRARIPLTVAGLRGGAASPFGDELDCVTPRRVLVRMRAVLRTQASLRRHRPFLTTSASVQEAKIAVRTEAGRPLVYAEVFESGRARLLTAPGCSAD